MYGLDDLDYARQRLVNTIVRFNGRAVWVRNIHDNGECVIEYLSVGTRRLCTLTDLNLKSVSLGYVNSNRGPHFVVRMPMREDWRQGVRLNNITTVGENRIDKNLITHRDLARTIKGTYPTYESVVGSTRLGDTNGLAWTREWAYINGYLAYRGDVVGVIDGDYEASLYEDFIHLDLSLEESMT